MRPRYLEIEGLQSFKEPQKIDFDRLSETGLFGIFGPTGSGKSTILDAITLALYGSVHRAAKGTQGIINTDMSGIKVIFTFDLTKEGSRKTYRVERLYKRKKDTENSVEAKVVRLLEIDDAGEHILADKHNDVNNFITQLVGLKFEDFTRSVVLPQNKFQEFLLSPRGEKTKMLERIFYLEEYGRQLGDKVNRQMSAVKNKLSNLEGALSTLGNASPEALIESERKLKEAQVLKDKCLEDQKKTELRYTEGMELYKLSNEYLTVQQQLEEQKGRLEEIEGIKEACKRAEAARDIKALIDIYSETKAGHDEAIAGLNATNEKLQAMETDKTAAKEGYEAIQKLKEQKLPELIKHKTILQQCQTLDQEAKQLQIQLENARKEYAETKAQMEQAQKIAQEKSNQRENQSQQLQELEKKLEELAVDNEYRSLVSQGMDIEKELNNLRQNLKKHTDKYDEINTSIGEHQRQCNNVQQAIKQCSEGLIELSNQSKELEELKPLDRQQLLELRNQITITENQHSKLLAELKSVTALENKLNNLSNQYSDMQHTTNDIEVRLNEALHKRQTKQEELKQRQYRQSQETAAILAQALVHGEECPVCGSKEHPHPAVHKLEYDIDKLSQELAELQAQIEADDMLIRGLEHELIKQSQQKKGIEENKRQLELDIEASQSECRKHRQALPEELRELDSDAISKYIEKEKQRCEDALEKWQEWEQKHQQLQDAIKGQEDILSDIKVKESRYAALLDSAKAALQQEQKQLDEINNSIELYNEKHFASIKQLGIESFMKEAQAIGMKDEQRQQLEKTVKLQRENLNALMLEIQELLEKINKINDVLADKRSEGIKLKEQKEEKDRKIAEILGSKDLTQELLNVDIEIQSLENSYKAALDKLNKVNETFAELQKAKSAFENSYAYFKDKLETSEQQLKEALKSKGFEDVNSVTSFLLSEQKLMEYQEEVKKYERLKGTLEDRVHAISKQLEGRLITLQQWQELCVEYENAKAKLEEHIAQLEGARNNYHLVKCNFERWLKLQEELQIISKRKDMLEQIQKLLKGNAFIEFISEERMRYIAREATETLGLLTKFRYSIELDSENGFVIRDNANGGVLRSVASLSGGETFLTSLSLALALSSQLQLKGQSPLEFFFLDEGFGTLDNALLDTVIDSLERLSSNKRVIGLISHVPELKNRIPRRLLIEPPDRQGNGSRVNIEKA